MVVPAIVTPVVLSAVTLGGVVLTFNVTVVVLTSPLSVAVWKVELAVVAL